jgi:dihydrofolate reductase
MRKCIYHVATTLDGFIADEQGGAQGFLPEGDHIPDFVASFSDYDAVLMGTKTYEYGFQFGLQPGQAAYPMKHYILSSTLQFDDNERVSLVRGDAAEFVKHLKAQDGKSIWLCGGAQLAASLLEHELIDELILKVNPVLFGKGLSLFNGSQKPVTLSLADTKLYQSGVVRLRYTLRYSS